MSSEYPTQEFVKAQIKAGKWPAKPGETLDIRSLSDREVKIIELYNQEETIKQLRRIADALEGNVFECAEEDNPSKLEGMISAVTGIIKDFSDDGQLNGSVAED